MPLFDRDKARDRGYTVAMLAYFAIGAVLYIAYGYMRWPLGDELAISIIAVISIFSIGILEPVATRYAIFEARRYCSKHGHLLKNETAGDGRLYVICTRCYTVMINEPV